MLSKRPHLMIRKLSELLVPGNRPAIPPEIPAVASPRSPLDVNFPSPGNSKRYDIGGVGLGIVAALEKSSSRGIKRHDVLAKYPVPSGSDPNRSDPLRCAGGKFRALEMDISNSEDYTYVTCHDGPTKCMITKVYYDDGVKFCNDLYDVVDDDGRMGFDRRWRKTVDVSDESPAAASTEIFRDSSCFLSSCCLCKKKLHGKDIYMYKGEKGFCSEDCRSVEIMNDERKEHCRSEVSVSRSPYDAGEQIFSAGIFVF